MYGHNMAFQSPQSARCTRQLYTFPGRVTPHSFRIGAATRAAVKGYTAEQITVFGRWRSNAYMSYIRVVNCKSPR